MNYELWTMNRKMLTLAHGKQCHGLSLVSSRAREESPGSIGRSTGESASSR